MPIIVNPKISEEEYDFSKDVQPKCSKEVEEAVNYVIDFYTKLMWNNNNRILSHNELKAASKPVLKKFGLTPAYPSVRQFIEEREAGAYNKFTFEMNDNVFTCHGVYDFLTMHGATVLDKCIVKKYKSIFVNDQAQGGTTYILEIAIKEE